MPRSSVFFFFFFGLAQLAAAEKQLISFRLMMWVNYGSSSSISQQSVGSALPLSLSLSPLSLFSHFSRFTFWAIQILSTGINGISFVHLVLISVGTWLRMVSFFRGFAFDCFAF